MPNQRKYCEIREQQRDVRLGAWDVPALRGTVPMASEATSGCRAVSSYAWK
jgi:hypothetical protein